MICLVKLISDIVLKNDKSTNLNTFTFSCVLNQFVAIFYSMERQKFKH